MQQLPYILDLEEYVSNEKRPNDQTAIEGVQKRHGGPSPRILRHMQRGEEIEMAGGSHFAPLRLLHPSQIRGQVKKVTF